MLAGLHSKGWINSPIWKKTTLFLWSGGTKTFLQAECIASGVRGCWGHRRTTVMWRILSFHQSLPQKWKSRDHSTILHSLQVSPRVNPRFGFGNGRIADVRLLWSSSGSGIFPWASKQLKVKLPPASLLPGQHNLNVVEFGWNTANSILFPTKGTFWF